MPRKRDTPTRNDLCAIQNFFKSGRVCGLFSSLHETNMTNASQNISSTYITNTESSNNNELWKA